MVFKGPHKTAVDDFFRAIQPSRDAYADDTFSYLAVRTDLGFLLLRGQYWFNVGTTNEVLRHFNSANVLAGSFKISDLAQTPEEFLEVITSGQFSIAGERILFTQSDMGGYRAYFQPLHEAGLLNQNRLNLLGVTGGANTEINRGAHLDWEVRASLTPYDGLAEIANEFQIGQVRTDYVSVEFIAPHVAAFDLASVVNGTKAKLGIRLSKKGKREKVRLGYRVFDRGKVSDRGALEGRLLDWTVENDIQLGWAEIDVPPAAVVNGIAIYAGISQHHGWALDRHAFQNPLRAIYETFDKGLTFLKEVLNREGRTGNSRDLETVCGWLLWMLGFGVANLGSTARTQDAPDLLASTPNGNQIVVEVTTGLLRAENKLTNLHDRAQAIKRSLAASSHTRVRVLPVIVTSKSREEVEPEVEQAERWGILVITRENFESIIGRTLVLPNAERLFDEADKAANDAKSKYSGPTA